MERNPWQMLMQGKDAICQLATVIFLESAGGFKQLLVGPLPWLLPGGYGRQDAKKDLKLAVALGIITLGMFYFLEMALDSVPER